ncbi:MULTISPECIES: aldehyde dehydrogenase [Rhodococcus]|uniref:Aldehyde dehydrogenase n=2 Tax=Rhodococcus TaxID=1827 RepID=A0AA46PU24_9NOCA|nr:MULTISPECIES: aldehyde dehydrogenase [Rhodococcus]MBX4171546.1 aldehyde dehydrogenase [Rhodococcus sp. DMU2021]MCD5422724.1 aldehyde dehydrogenase [Rhodococcus pyridinivorans]MCW3471154.1 aldehyde dehydrogenase [Rhodococcus pyridinivorans]MDV6296811.1 aldehyde dehydrogenase [Rhodococcus aetherivorans]QXF82488.1 aldehyde dehydrogenase [Rhodococcus pyridinivorans]
MMTKLPSVPLANTDCLYIDGKWVPPHSSALIDVVDSTNELVYYSVPDADVDDIDRAITAARQAFDEGPWPRLSHAERAQVLLDIADAVEARIDDIVEIWPRETGILASSVPGVMREVIDAYRYYAGLAKSFPFQEEVTPTNGARFGMIVKEPVGVVGAIIPWNAPMGLIAFKVAPALLAGCTVVIKSSPEAPGAGYIMAEIADQLGIPAGVLNVVTADRAASERLVSDPRVDKISFTGSTEVGKRIGSILGGRIARSSLELGGKSPAIVLDDFDIAEAAHTIASAECFLSGQICASLTRIIVSEERHDEMVKALADEFDRVVIGDPYDPQVTLGPLASDRQRDRVENYIQIGIREGATLAYGGGRPSHLDRGWFVEPTVFGNVSETSRIAQEEIFGPVLAVTPARDLTDAVRIANATEFGLNAAVFTHDSKKVFDIARRLHSGTVGQNGNRVDFGIGFGGFKRSGIGREGGVAGLQAYLENKTVVLDAPPE